jgi:hypothetical protein
MSESVVKDFLPIAFSGVALLLSIFTLWVTQFRHGQLRMTQPTLLCLRREKPYGVPKLFLRTLMYSTASKGLVVESMFLRIKNSYGTYVFDFWGHTESGKLTLGSGVFASSTGSAADHHFSPRQDANRFVFTSGEYRVEVFAAVVGQAEPRRLKEVTFTVDVSQSAELTQIHDTELFLFWNAERRGYEGQSHRGPGIPAPPLWGHIQSPDFTFRDESSSDRPGE